jgi:hypothetical protein
MEAWVGRGREYDGASEGPSTLTYVCGKTYGTKRQYFLANDSAACGSTA